MTTEPWLKITTEQYQKGWIEMRGVTPIHHNFLLIMDHGDGTMTVRNPRLQFEEWELQNVPRRENA